jgi:putative nucleotidyltransferase with HDIG domain
MPLLKDCEALIQNINAALKNYSFYPKGHPYVSQPIKKSFNLIESFIAEDGEVLISYVDGIIWVQNIPIPQEFLWDVVVKIFIKLKKESLVIMNGITPTEWENFVREVATNLMKDVSLINLEFEHIQLGAIEKDSKKEAIEVYNEAKAVIQRVIADVRLGKIPKAEDVKFVVNKMLDQVLKNKQTMIALTLIKSYDDYLFNHSVNVAILSLALGETLKLRPDLLKELGTAAMLHDIGKVSIDPKVVMKPDKLTEEEWQEMKKHPVNGYEILKQMEGLSEVIYRVALEHHMKYDLSGYPEIPKDYKLHPASLILSICDCYDAMTTHRVYQRCYEPREALEFMSKMAGKNFEPNYLKAFIKMLGIYPQGTLVKINTGETGIVVRPNPSSPDEPIIKVIYDIFGNKLENIKTIDLSQHPVDEETGLEIKIVGTVNPSWHDIDVAEYALSD